MLAHIPVFKKKLPLIDCDWPPPLHLHNNNKWSCGAWRAARRQQASKLKVGNLLECLRLWENLNFVLYTHSTTCCCRWVWVWVDNPGAFLFLCMHVYITMFSYYVCETRRSVLSSRTHWTSDMRTWRCCRLQTSRWWDKRIFLMKRASSRFMQSLWSITSEVECEFLIREIMTSRRPDNHTLISYFL